MKNVSVYRESYRSFRKAMRKELEKTTDVEERNFQYSSFLEEKIEEQTIYFEANGSWSVSGNPRALFERMIRNPKFSSYTFIWGIHSAGIIQKVSPAYSDYKNVKFVVTEGEEYLRSMATAKYLVTDNRFPVWFVRRDEQVYINMSAHWEQNYMGYESNYFYSEMSRVGSKDYLSANIILSMGRQYTNQILRKAFKLETLFEGIVAEGIMPQFEYMGSLSRSQAIENCCQEGVTINPEQKLALVIWDNMSDFSYKMKFVYDLEKELQKKGIQVCLKIPVGQYRKIMEELGERNSSILLLKNFSKLEDWFIASDYLVCDLNSYLFEYTVTGKNAFVFQKGNLKEGYFSYKELPGIIVEEVSDCIQKMIGDEGMNSDEQRCTQECKSLVMPKGGASILERLLPVFLGQEYENGLSLKTKKEKILFMAPLGELEKKEYFNWTRNLFTVLDWIDYEKYDVTVLTNRFMTYERMMEIQNQINPNVRMLWRAGMMLQNRECYIDFKYLSYNLIYGDDIESICQDIDDSMCKWEWRRLAGSAEFDQGIYAGRIIGTLFMIFHNLKVKRKVYLDFRDYSTVFPHCEQTPMQEVLYKNTFAMLEEFDSVVHVNESTVDFLKDNNAFSSFKKHICFPCFESPKIFAGEETSPMEGTFCGKEMWILESTPYSGINCVGKMMRKPLKDEVSIVSAIHYRTKADAERLLAEFKKIKEQYINARLYIFDIQNQWNESFDTLLGNYDLKGDVYLCDAILTSSMLPLFQYYLSCEQEDVYRQLCGEQQVLFRYMEEPGWYIPQQTIENLEKEIQKEVNDVLFG